MTKKFMSLVLSMVLIIGLLPAMSIGAENAESTVVSHFNEDFETWPTGTKFNEGYTFTSTLPAISSDGTFGKNSTNTRFSLGSNFFAEVISMPGYDGKTTNAFKLVAKSDASVWVENTPGAGRFDCNTTLTDVTTGIYVQEFKLYHTDNEIHKFIFGKLGKVGDKLVDAKGINQISDYTTAGSLVDGWNKIVAVNDLDNRKVILYINDELVGYGKRNHSGDNSFAASKRIQVGAYNVDDWKDKSLILDDFNLYSNPDLTNASSDYANAISVPANANVTVDFDQMLLVTTIAGSATVSTSNVTVTNSQGKPVELEKVTATDDNYSIIIEPKSDLAKGETYTVNVSGLKDMYDQTIPAYEFSFTTAEDAKITASAPVFSVVDFDNGTVSKIDALQNGYVSASYTVTNGASSAKNIIMLAVLKDGDTIERFQFKPVTLGANIETNFNGGFKIENAATQKIEIYIWDDMCNMTPLADKYVIDADGIESINIQ